MIGGKSALHVDDDLLMCRLVRSLLERVGFRVASAHDTMSALSALYERAPDLIILDVDLGEESGYELCRIIREGGTTAPVVFITARRTLLDLRRVQAVGGDHLIVKPFTAAALLAGVERVMAAHQ